ncbi:3-oxoacyl-ACP reductase, partial [Candidatus Micrarchaeota archaeon CG09_land_8_20_14_0_10_60_16]
MFGLKGKTAVVTGAAKGIGKGVALAMAAQGASVVVSDLSEGDCQAVVKEIEAKGGKAMAFKADVGRKAEVDALVAAAAA